MVPGTVTQANDVATRGTHQLPVNLAVASGVPRTVSALPLIKRFSTNTTSDPFSSPGMSFTSCAIVLCAAVQAYAYESCFFISRQKQMFCLLLFNLRS